MEGTREMPYGHVEANVGIDVPSSINVDAMQLRSSAQQWNPQHGNRSFCGIGSGKSFASPSQVNIETSSGAVPRLLVTGMEGAAEQLRQRAMNSSFCATSLPPNLLQTINNSFARLPPDPVTSGPSPSPQPYTYDATAASVGTEQINLTPPPNENGILTPVPVYQSVEPGDPAAVTAAYRRKNASFCRPTGRFSTTQRGATQATFDTDPMVSVASPEGETELEAHLPQKKPSLMVRPSAAVQNHSMVCYHYMIGKSEDEYDGISESPLLGEANVNTGKSPCTIPQFPEKDADLESSYHPPFGEEKQSAAEKPKNPRGGFLKYDCNSSEDLDDDTVSILATVQGIFTPILRANMIYALRITLVTIVPTFLLVHHEKTASYFVAGSLIPVISSLFVREDIGAQLMMCITGMHCVAVFMLWGVIMNALGAVNNTTSWWAALAVGVFVFSQFGEMPAKRLAMMYIVMIMQTEHIPGGETLTFPCKFARDFMIAVFFSLLGCLIPYPLLSRNKANTTLEALFKLHAVAIGNAVKAFWAPVSIDAQFATNQTPLPQSRVLSAQLAREIYFASYEPFERSLANQMRKERMAMLSCLQANIYTLYAAATQRIEEMIRFEERPRSSVLQDFDRRLRQPALDMSDALIVVISQLGKTLLPRDTIEKVEYKPLYEKAEVLASLLDQACLDILYVKDVTPTDTNAFLSSITFHAGLLQIVEECRKMEESMRNFDETDYTPTWIRFREFFFLEMWRNFWTELPKRFTLPTRKDERQLKDGIKYSLAYLSVCAFTLNANHTKIDYFGVTILMRLAQQTSAETLLMSYNCICGVCIGAPLAYLTYQKTTTLLQATPLVCFFIFIAFCFSRNGTIGLGAQYTVVVLLAFYSMGGDTGLMMQRIENNVFAFITYFVICNLVFPVDPIRVLWSTRTKIIISINDTIQQLGAIGCMCVTQSGENAAGLLRDAQAMMGKQRGLLAMYENWMSKASVEPTVRGGEYPTQACSTLFTQLTELSSLLDALVLTWSHLHAQREVEPGLLINELINRMRPFLEDVSKISALYLQSLIDATERPMEWGVQESLTCLWKAECARKGLRTMTGNLQKNFISVIQQLMPEEQRNINTYITSSFVHDTVLQTGYFDPAMDMDNADTHDMLQRLLAFSFHVSKEQPITRADLQSLGSLFVNYKLLLKSFERLLQPMVRIHDYEKSRVQHFYINPTN